MGDTFYITTAINYTNGAPHIGHAYEALTTDVIARYYRLVGRDVFFLTGTDEHGMKISRTAEKLGMTPMELCDKNAALFVELNKRLLISNDGFIRTTDAEHTARSQRLFQTVFEKGEIYLGRYAGWYSVREERFVPDNEAKSSDFKDSETGLPLERMEEASYFFKMGLYQAKLVEHINSHPDFIQPSTRRNEILERLKEPLRDLSVSRATFDWGIPLLNDPDHVIYVWFDALSNYITGIEYPDGENARYWPADVHIIGKDIIWFHAVIWPIILMAADIPLPRCVFAHGFVKAAEGKKMSKSLGNVVDPSILLEKYGADALRYSLVRDGRYGEDVSFSEGGLIKRFNGELADELGNLFNRVLSLLKRYGDGIVPEVAAEPIFNLQVLSDNLEKHFSKLALTSALAEVHSACKDVTRYVSEKEPWKMEDADERLRIIKSAAEALVILAHFYMPFIPVAASKILERLGVKLMTVSDLNWNALEVGKSLSPGSVLFKKIDMSEMLEPIQLLDLRVGKVLNVGDHPNAERLYLVEVDLGEGTPRQLVAGLKSFFTPDELLGKGLVVVTNLKPSKIRGEYSQGMLLAAEKDESVVLLNPGDASIGSTVLAKGLASVPGNNLKFKKFEEVTFDVKNRRVCVSGRPLLAGGKEVRVEIGDGASVH